MAMARPLRVNLPQSWHHVMSRGNGGERIFRNDTDRRRFFGLVAELPERFSAEVHAFVLVDNHYLLLRMDPRRQTAARRIPRSARPSWKQMVQVRRADPGAPLDRNDRGLRGLGEIGYLLWRPATWGGVQPRWCGKFADRAMRLLRRESGVSGSRYPFAPK